MSSKNIVIICALRGHKQLKRVPLSAWRSAVCPPAAGDGPWHTIVVQLPVTPTFSTGPAPDLTQSCYPALSQPSVEKCLRATSPSALPSGTGWKLSCEMALKQNRRKRGQVCSERSPCRLCGDLRSTPGKQNW